MGEDSLRMGMGRGGETFVMVQGKEGDGLPCGQGPGNGEKQMSREVFTTRLYG